MGHIANELHEIFPAHAARLPGLKASHRHFHKLAEHYDALNREIQHIEAGLEPASDDRLGGLKRQRFAVVDEIAQFLEQHEAPQ